ncbi:MAG TPA: glycosyltransferase 87 family protein, partial [Ktedonobacteraceae bacterium]|nr:glycosyltransferase 87 family protein [Ktedonobacteraceae bacterium]
MRTLHEQKGLQPAARPVAPPYPWWRLLVLCGLFLLSVIISILLIGAKPRNDYDIQPFLHVEILSFLPYLAACAFVLLTKPAIGRWRWIEIGAILLGALLLRVILLPLPPGLSHDSWRYLWDARVTLHGFSPYVYAPFDKALIPLRDSVLLPNSRFRTAPTIYPPGAQGVFLLSYLLAGSNLYFLKSIFLVFDMVTCIALIILLGRKGLDQRRVILYAWCPLPIIEFAIEGHVDVITLTFTILAVLAASNTSMRGRLLTGFLIGLATLTKIYPILLLVALVPALQTRGDRLWSFRNGADKSAMGA